MGVYFPVSFEWVERQWDCFHSLWENFESFEETSCYDVLAANEFSSTDYFVVVDSVTVAAKSNSFNVGD